MGFFPAGTYDLFLTHAWHYTDEWQRVVAALDGYLPGKWRNWSIPWHDTSIERHSAQGKAALEKLLDGHISMSSAILLLPEVRNLPDGAMWLEKQLRIAAHHSKPVIGVVQDENSLRRSLLSSLGIRSNFPVDLRGRVNEVSGRNAAAIIKAVDRFCR